MARTCVVVPYSIPFPTVKSTIEQILTKEGFKLKDYNGELVYKKGTGFATAMQYLKVDYTESEIYIFGWIQMGLGSIGGKEHDLTGMMAKLPKSNLQKRIDLIAQTIRSMH